LVWDGIWYEYLANFCNNQSKQSSNRRKFAQSGHSAAYIIYGISETVSRILLLQVVAKWVLGNLIIISTPRPIPKSNLALNSLFMRPSPKYLPRLFSMHSFIPRELPPPSSSNHSISNSAHRS
jgi:hypothetical protein